jgi:hypothetical protein
MDGIFTEVPSCLVDFSPFGNKFLTSKEEKDVHHTNNYPSSLVQPPCSVWRLPITLRSMLMKELLVLLLPFMLLAALLSC